mgnify:CR=1 FL=1
MQNSQKTKLIPVTKWPEIHKWPPIGGLRHLIHNSSKNGFDHCIVRIGRRVLINEAKFFEWAETSTDS